MMTKFIPIDDIVMCPDISLLIEKYGVKVIIIAVDEVDVC